LRSKQPKPYLPPIEQAEVPLDKAKTFGRIISTMPEYPSQRHVNCYDQDFQPPKGENIDNLWIDKPIHFGSMRVKTQQNLIEDKLDESLQRCKPGKWRIDIETKIADEQLAKQVSSKTKDGVGLQGLL